jgi:uncharacterized protein YjbI with pentapeptide repeats
MIFLGKIYLEAGGLRLGVRGDGRLAMRQLVPNDPAGMFLAYDVGNGWFALQSHTGLWANFYAGQSPIAWYPVLYSATVTGLGTFGRFDMRFFDTANRRVRIIVTSENSERVGVMVTPGFYCNCDFDVAAGPFGTYFNMGVVAAGVPELQQSKTGAGGNFTCLGKACVDVSAIEFTGVNFQDADFGGANLRAVKFSDCALTRTKFHGANLSSTDFRGSSVAGADFSNADLTNGTLLPDPPLSNDAGKRTVFRNAKVPASALKKNWSYLDLTKAQIVELDGADLTGLVARYTLGPELVLAGAVLDNADFSNSDFSKTQFQFASLEQAKFQSSTLIDAIFTRCKLQGASFDPNPSDPNSEGTDVTGDRFSFANLARASMKQALLMRAVFTAANMDEIDLTSAQLGGLDAAAAASLSYAYLANVKLDKANLFGVNFGFVTLFGASTSVTQTSTMEQANFSNAYLAGIDLTEANLRGASFVGACLVNVRFKNANFLPTASGSVVASLAGATLQGADFTGAKLNDADLSNAAVAFANGQIPVRYCDEVGFPFPEPPNSMPLRFQSTIGLNLETMGPDTKCPNGYTVYENQLNNRTLQQMLTSANAPTSWFPGKCGPPPQAYAIG